MSSKSCYKCGEYPADFSYKAISFKQLQISKIGYPSAAIPALIAIHLAVSTLSPVNIHNLIPASKIHNKQ